MVSEQEDVVTMWGPKLTKNKKVSIEDSNPNRKVRTNPGLRHILFGILVTTLIAPIIELVVLIPYLLHKYPALINNPSSLLLKANDFLTSNVVALLGGLILTWIGLTGPVFWAGRKFLGGWKKMVNWKFVWKTDLLIALVFAIGARTLEAIVNEILKLIHIDASKLTNGALLTSSGSKWIPLLTIGASIGAPIAEELFFRGLVLSVAKRKFGKIVGVLISSTLFGLVHIQPTVSASIYMFFSTAILGAMLALLVLKTNRLGTSILAHGTFNASAGLFALL